MEKNEKLCNTDGGGTKRNRDQRTGDGSEKGADDGGGIDASGSVRESGDLRQQNSRLYQPEGIGSMLKTKINVNLGVSRDCKDYNVEMEKVMEAVRMGAHAIMDLSSMGIRYRSGASLPTSVRL